MKKILETISAVLITIAVALFLLGMMGTTIGLSDEQTFNWKAPMPWAIIFALSGLMSILVSRHIITK